MIDNQALIIGLAVGSVVLLIIIILIIVCICCKKCERCFTRRGVKRDEKKYEKERADLSLEQRQRKDELNAKHEEIRKKYGLGKYSGSGSAAPFNETVYSVEKEHVNITVK